MNLPDISVVMGVYNEEDALPRTIKSILNQTGVLLEFIIINDGSTDDSRKIIQSYSEKDDRITLIDQDNQGLTSALITGCNQARGRFIARQDVGDISIAGRLSTQFEAIKNNASASLISTATRFVTPSNEELYVVSQNSEEASNSLNAIISNKLNGPSHHGSTMFPRNLYHSVGGYRKEFTVAQDLDLWTRLAEHGEVLALEEILYCATIERNSISARKRLQQIKASEYILRCTLARSRGEDDQIVLNELDLEGSVRSEKIISQRELDAAYYYFIGSNLLIKNPLASRRYLETSIKLAPFNWKTYAKIIYAYVSLISHQIKLFFRR